MMLRSVSLAAAALVGMAAVGVSQDIVPLRTDSTVAPRLRPDGSTLAPVVLTYMATLQQAVTAKSLGERSVQIRRTVYAGLAAWEVTETRGSGSAASVDTVVVDFQSLVPLHWGTSQPLPGSQSGQLAARISAEFRGDSMIGSVSSPGGRRSMIVPVPSGAYLTAAQFEVALRALPISAGFRDSVELMMTDLVKMTPVHASVAVVGEETIVTGAGSYECWLVSLVSGSGRADYWISKTDRIVAKVSQVVPETGEILIYQLMSISH